MKNNNHSMSSFSESKLSVEKSIQDFFEQCTQAENICIGNKEDEENLIQNVSQFNSLLEDCYNKIYIAQDYSLYTMEAIIRS